MKHRIVLISLFEPLLKGYTEKMLHFLFWLILTVQFFYSMVENHLNFCVYSTHFKIIVHYGAEQLNSQNEFKL